MLSECDHTMNLTRYHNLPHLNLESRISLTLYSSWSSTMTGPGCRGCRCLSQLAMGCVTCHTCHGCVTDFRPILGNIVEVTLVTSPILYIVSHAKGTSLP